MQQKNQKLREYVAPRIEQLQARVERGFAGSAEPAPTHSSTESLTNGNSYGGSDFTD